jgi:hypothetical protein
MTVQLKVAIRLIALTIALLGLAPSSLPAFEVFDATLYKAKPSLAAAGLRPIAVIYAQQIWGPNESRKELPKQSRIIERIVKIPPAHRIVVLDFEHWPLQGYRYRPWIYSQSISRLIDTFDMFKAYRPSLRFGYFAQIPVCHFKRAILPSDHPDHVIWQNDVRRVQPLAAKVDVIFPSAYTYTDSREDWEKFISVSIAEAKQIYRGEIYPFIWPQFYNRRPTPENLQAKYIDPEFWRFQLDTLYALTDGVVIWGGWDFENKQAARWDESAPWWQITKKFLVEKGLAKICTAGTDHLLNKSRPISP